jgi:hypothetical protein
VQYDAYPEEFGFSIVDVETGAVAISYPAETFFEPNKLLSEDVELERGRKYNLVMMDTFADGICCENGNGFVEVKLGDIFLVNTWGDIGQSWSQPFTVPFSGR